jgi:hypothetical protein
VVTPLKTGNMRPQGLAGSGLGDTGSSQDTDGRTSREPGEQHGNRAALLAVGRDAALEPRTRHPSAAQTRPLKGFIDVANSTRVRGWAWRPSNPDERVRLELVEDGQCLAIAVADKFRADLEIGGIGDGRHAFAFELSPGSLTAGPHVLELRCQETSARFGAPFLIEQPASSAVALAPAAPPPGAPAPAAIQPLAQPARDEAGTSWHAGASAEDRDISSAGTDALDTAPGKEPAEFFVTTDDFDEPDYVPMIARQDPAMPAALEPAPPKATAQPVLKGHVDGIQDDWTLAGWAYAPASDGPLIVELTERGFVVADIIANRHRQDLQAAGYGNGACGFRIRIPSALFDGAFHELRLNAVVDGHRLALGAPLGMVFPDNFKDRGGILPAADIFDLVVKGASSSAVMDEPRLKELAAVFQQLGKRFGHATSLRLMYTHILRRPIDANALVTRLTRVNTDPNQYLPLLEEIVFSAESRQIYQDNYSAIAPIGYLRAWVQDDTEKTDVAR